MLHDLRYAVRMLLKSPGFTAVAVITLALGIGANTAISSYVIAWIVRPLPYPNGDRLLVLRWQNQKQGWASSYAPAADFYDWQRQSRAFEQLASWNAAPFDLTSDGPPQRVAGARVTWNFFQTLGVRPATGRWFSPQEDRPGGGDVVILTWGFWQTRFGADPHVIGRTITLNERPYTVIGVTSSDFHFPLVGAASLWVPLAFTDQQLADRRNRVEVIGRLRPGVTRGDAEADLDAMMASRARVYPGTNAGVTILLKSLRDAIGENAGTPEALVVFWIVWLVLLIACANVANLMLARASHRGRELAVRAAIGASRWRVMRQLLTETIVLFVAGGAAGAFAALFGLDWLDSIIPANARAEMPNFGHVKLDWDIFAYTLGASVLCGLLFGFAPALLSSKVDLNTALKDAAAQTSSSKRRGRLRNIFVAGEIALALMVIVCSALLIETFVRLMPTQTGFEPRNLMVASINLPAQKYHDPQQMRAFYDQVLRRVRALPQVTAAAGAEALPFASMRMEPVGPPAGAGTRPLFVAYSAVTPEYFQTMQIPVLRGRTFSSQDGAGAPNVVVVDEDLARRYWPHGAALGSQLRITAPYLDNPLCTVIGVVRHVQWWVGGRRDPELYVAFAQFPSPGVHIVARSTADPLVVAGAIRDSVWAEDRYQPLTFIRPMPDIIAEGNGPWRAMAQVVGFFSFLALLLGALGIYGVTSYTVAQRSHEIGIRVALGAQKRDVLHLVLGHGLRLAAVGIGFGVLGALGAARFLAFLLYGVGPSDPPTFITTALLLSAVAALACYVPARRATKVDPMAALRYE